MKNGTTVTTVRPEIGRDLGAREAQSWTNAQIPYPNLAGNEKLSKRAVAFVREIREKWDAETFEHQFAWRGIDYLFDGNSLFRRGTSKTHVPEVLKAHRSILPRLLEAFLGNGESWFAAAGVDRDDRYREAAITARLELELEQNRFPELLERAFDCLLRKGVMCFKGGWDRRVRRQVYHRTEPITQEDGRVKINHFREFRDVVPYEGNKVWVVDPYRLLVDAQRCDLDDLDYIGDFGDVPVDEVLANKNYLNLETIRERSRSGGLVTGSGKVTTAMAARGGLRPQNSDTPVRPVTGGRSRIEVTEVWGWFDFQTEEGREADMREACIVIGDGDICLRLCENFHDDKHRPYSIGRFTQEGFEFYTAGLYVPALPVQDEMDHFRGITYDAAESAAYPRLAVSGLGSDLPTSILDLPNGAIIRDAAGATWQPSPNTLQHVPMIDSMMRRDVEEILGIPRIWQGTESAPGQDTTATEIRRKIEEGNRRLMGLIRAADTCTRGLLRMMHANNQQFVTEKTAYRTMNKRLARVLTARSGEIGPLELTHSVDFTIYGVKRIQQYGLRGTNLLTFMQVAGSILQEYPGIVNVEALVLDVYRQLVGSQQGDEVINDRTKIEDLEDQTSENMRLRQGMVVAVDPLDNAQQHIAKMQREGMLEWAQSLPDGDARKINTLQHYYDHLVQAEKQSVQDGARMADAQRRGQAPADQKEAPPAGGMERNARETPGPGTGHQIAPVGRSQPIPQSRNGY